MSYDSAKARELIASTDKAPPRIVSHTERAYANILQEADDELTQVKFALGMGVKVIEAGAKERRELCARIAELEQKLSGAIR